MNRDYIPLDQAVINREIERMAQSSKSARDILREAYKEAGGNFDIIVFRKFKRIIIKALEELRISWYEYDGEILANRHEVEDYIRE